mgnify:CR=1 FL=1
MDLDRRRRLWRWSIFLPRRLQFDEQLPALRGYEATVGKSIDDTFNAPEVGAVDGGAVTVVLAEIQASAADIHVPLEGSIAASSSVRHRAGLEPLFGHGIRGIRASLLSSSNRLRLDSQALIPVGRGRVTRRHLSA